MAGNEGSRAEEGSSSGITARCVRVRIQGIVQGVGFRPFIHQLARQYGLDGWVRNQSDGVEVEVAGGHKETEEFLRDIPAKAPPLARIVALDISEGGVSQDGHCLPLVGFHILESRREQNRLTLIPPDACTCDDCLRELSDAADRRYRYPFINCTNCGPRYTIIQDIPYDRDKTTMDRFSMCPSCRAEYEDPADRRFHAQPNGCWDCGPQVWLEPAVDGSNGSDAARVLARRDEAVREAVRQLDAGAVLAIKGLGGFHLAVDAANEAAVDRLRSRKVREEKPFAVMFRDMETIGRYCRVSEREASLLQSSRRPIVLLERMPKPSPSRQIASAVAPRNRFLGAFLPYTPLHYLLFSGSSFRALVMTSGNRSDEPIVTGNEDARERLGGIADFFLFHDRDIYMRCDDSVIRVVQGRPRPVRRARGYVPVPVFLEESVPAVLGVGAELKNTVCLTRGREAFLSQHIGDLENLETLHSFELTISHLERILDIELKLVVHDLHPDYLSTRWAMEQNRLPRMAVQHHHAHIAAVAAERQVSGPLLGIALDGTGYGTDGTVWGGEILLVDGDRFERLGHLRQVPLPGGDQAVREPWRTAVSYLWSMDPEGVETSHSDILERWPRRKVKLLLQMLEKRINTPITSSCGRLFDAVSSLAGVRDCATYEGQAAIELEQAMAPDESAYRGEVRREGGAIWILDTFPMMAEVVEDVRHGTGAGIISSRFHNGLLRLLVDAAIEISRETGLRRVALSGGVFQNAYLSEHLEKMLVSQGLEVFSHLETPPNDGCIALGQACLGAARLHRRKGHTE